ncbi:hypothetical protein PFICI_12378 [Pestalotiopsis fici W106-1]|uniref:WSC domain-containing protein n=1 Tax=Pestalotiopsis fici (strain W106-1 / CGMCC3.15140) TaxID=1229662 RepID=W3WNR3_PESFW|nr:uncharacterized protein PFICI_12378 [Pestalotiopsis fici W106-1]ETS75434.1 hypothetical protein PFICI_12378 [Pestalotiopsis fici W106-1]
MCAFLRLVPIAFLATGVFSVPATNEVLVAKAVTPGFTYKGCYSEPPGGRAIELKSYSDNKNMTTESCAAFCDDYQLFGTEYGEQCFCGNVLAAGSSPADGCTMNCTGNNSQKCGGPARLSLYNNTNYRAPSVATIPGWTYQGCHTEGPNGARVLSYRNPQDVSTPQACTSACGAAGYRLAGVEYGSECWCGNTLQGGSFVDTDSQTTQCNFRCAGDKYSFCGAGSRLVVYAAVTAADVAGWRYQGCYVDNAGGKRNLDALSSYTDDNTAQSCASFCSQYSYFGVENGNECFCGLSLNSTYTPTSNSSCAKPCSGDKNQTCGDFGFQSIYESVPLKPAPSNQAVVAGKFNYKFCSFDDNNARVLAANTNANDAMTVEMCAAFCNSYSYFGVEYGKECYCGDSFSGSPAQEKDCSYLCPGNSTELCGAANRINIWGPATATLI